MVIASLDDAKNARIGAMTGSTRRSGVMNRFPDAHVKSFDDVMDAVAAMKSGQLDGDCDGIPCGSSSFEKIRN